jgi:hypothetical protein
VSNATAMADGQGSSSTCSGRQLLDLWAAKI